MNGMKRKENEFWENDTNSRDNILAYTSEDFLNAQKEEAKTWSLTEVSEIAYNK